MKGTFVIDKQHIDVRLIFYQYCYQMKAQKIPRKVWCQNTRNNTVYPYIKGSNTFINGGRNKYDKLVDLLVLKCCKSHTYTHT